LRRLLQLNRSFSKRARGQIRARKHLSMSGRRKQTPMTPTSTTEDGLALSAVRSGQHVRIHRIRGGHHFLSRLASLGFTPGARLRVVQNFGRGPIIVNLRDTRVALGRGEAAKIEVEAQGGKDGT
jgi:ferrous iron transport protein A